MRVNIVVIDSQGRKTEDLVVEVEPSITPRKIVEGLKRDAPDILPEESENYSVRIEPPQDKPLSGNFLQEGSTLIITPKTGLFRILKRGNS